MSNVCRPGRSISGAGAAQRGVVLVIALIFLMLLTILAISASSRSLLQQRMAGGLLNAQRAEMSAQTALRGVEWRLWSSVADLTTSLGCGSSLFPACYFFDPVSPVEDAVKFRTTPGWVTKGGEEYLGGLDEDIDFTATDHGRLAENPWFIVEYMGPVVSAGPQAESGVTNDEPEYYMYRITARATGGDRNTVRVLQSTFDSRTPPR